MTFRTEFPHFSAASMPAIPAEWVDVSWHNDACPCFEASRDLFVYIDHAEASERECGPNALRFSVQRLRDGEHTSLMDSDDWQAVLAKVEREQTVSRIADAFRTTIGEWFKPDELAQVAIRNHAAGKDSPCCATHDFCDANEAMHEAFKAVTGRDPLDSEDCSGMSQADTVLWNDAWSLAYDRGFMTPEAFRDIVAAARKEAEDEDEDLYEAFNALCQVAEALLPAPVFEAFEAFNLKATMAETVTEADALVCRHALDSITAFEVAEASRVADLDAAAHGLQTRALIHDGGVASISLPRNDAWPAMAEDARAAALHAWLATERNHLSTLSDAKA